MMWKGLGVLLGAAAVVVLGVLGLARLTVPDEPSFVDDLEEAEAGGNGDVFVPDAVGGRLTVSGARDGTIDLEPKGNGPNFGLGNSKTQVYFEGGPLSVTQMDHDGLSFFPDPDDCQFTTGEHNEAVGIAAVAMSCPGLVDIRGNGTLTVEGQLALPADLVLSVEIPETGGTITVGGEEWEVVPDVILFVGGSWIGEDDQPGLALNTDELGAVFVRYDADSDTFAVWGVTNDGSDMAEISPEACHVDIEELMVVNPESRIRQLTIACDAVQVPGMGSVSIDGDVVFQEIRVLEEH